MKIIHASLMLIAPMLLLSQVVSVVPVVQQEDELQQWTQGWSMNIGAGFMNVHAKSYIRDPDDLALRESQLNWDTTNAPVVHASLQRQISPLAQVSFYGNFSVDGDGQLNDYDWIDPENYDRTYAFDDWTHHSQSPTNLLHAVQLGVKYSYLAYRQKQFDVSAIGLLQYFSVHWEDHGGHYVYSDYDTSEPDNGFRDDEGDFVDMPGITYRQDRKSIGIGARFVWHGEHGGDYFAEAVLGKDFDTLTHDIHVLRATFFDTDYSGAEYPTYKSILVGFSGHVSPHLSYLIESSYVDHGLIKGDEIGCDYTGCDSWAANDWTKMNEQITTASLEMRY